MVPHPAGGVATGQVGYKIMAAAVQIFIFLRAGARPPSNYSGTDGTSGRDDTGIRVPTVIATICKVDIDCYGGTDGARAARTGGRGLF